MPSLQAVLHQARRFNQASGPLQGLMIIELKAAAPLCDPADAQERAIVLAVTEVVRRLRMTDQVMLASFSPALLQSAQQHAPEITRVLTLSGLQFLSAADVSARLGLPVTLIHKRLDLGLQWAEIGSIYRLPGYRSPAEALRTAGITGARLVEADLFLLANAGQPFVEALHGAGLEILGFTATSAAEWLFMESLGLDGIYTNDVPFGVAHEAPVP